MKHKEENVTTESEKLPWTSISFACGGWLQFYLYGVARALQSKGLDFPEVTYCGCSAGSLTAVGLALEGDFDAAVDFIKTECMPRTYTNASGLFRIQEYVGNCIDLLLVPKFKKVANVQIAVTSLPFLKAERMSQFTDPEDLKSALLASCAAFPFSPFVYTRGKWYMDGGVSDFQPVLDDEQTLTVSPFYFSDCDIKPSRYVPLWWAFAPPNSNDTIDWLYNLGFEDALAYLRKNKIPASSRAKTHIRAFAKNPHPYDTPRRISLHRLLGYDLSHITHEYVPFVLDFLLLLTLLLVLKPLVLCLIYVEIVLRVVCYFAFSGIVELCIITPLVAVMHAVSSSPVVKCRMSCVLLLEKLMLAGPSQHSKFGECLDCLRCLCSMSLFLRFFANACSKEQLRKHKQLVKSRIGVSRRRNLPCHYHYSAGNASVVTYATCTSSSSRSTNCRFVFNLSLSRSPAAAAMLLAGAQYW